ncbi:MAG: ATP-binding cassette domain-containing protein [Brooklawnia sp.]|jgi:putative ABC transport system permease protein
MLQLTNVSKSYTTADFTQRALDDVSIAFRDNEFVAVLGPSGSGKTTMLNIVGGLDHYDSGDLIIDEVSTKQYRDRDWDTYRNNRIGFVFQSYNLIPHQTVLANVELALTLTGVSRGERRARALAALDEVGLADHVHKRPNQLSGGQMQRVAIARALINDPEILLADEPTGALDSTTSLQIMALLTEIADDRLVIMVTHNPELAEQYATRVVNLRDGQVVGDTDPFDPAADDLRESEKQVRRTSMSFLTALALSFNNLMTKKGRTLMTAFAGSIGIMGIAAILALATGVNDYVRSIEEDTLSVYPLTIMSQGFDMTSMLAMSTDLGDDPGRDAAGADADVYEIQAMNRMFSSIAANDLAALKEYLDGNGGNIKDYVNSIEYSYAVTPQIFNSDTSDGVRQVNPDNTFASLGFGSAASSNSLMSASMSTNIFNEMVGDISLIEPQFDVVAGRWPTAYDEVVVVLTEGGGVSDLMLYSMGLRDPEVLDAMVQQMVNEEEIITPDDSKSFSYDQIMDVTFKLVNAADYYVYDETFEVWTDKSGDAAHLSGLVEDGTELRISGIVQPSGDTTATALVPGIYYTPDLTTHLVNQAARTEVVQDQLADPKLNVFSGRTFADEAENPRDSDFDMSSLVSVDANAMQAAFTFDESALALDLSGVNLDFSGLNMDASAMNLDLSNIEIDMSGMEIDPSSLPDLDLIEILGQIEFSLDDVDGELAQEVGAGLVRGYLEYAQANDLDVTDVQTNFPLFIASETGQELVEQAEGIIDLDDLMGQLETILADYMQQAMTTLMTQFADQLGTAIQDQIGTVMQQQIGTALQTRIGSAIEAQLGTAMQTAMNQLATNMSGAMGIDEEAFMDAFEFNMDEEDLSDLMMSMMSTGQTSYDSNLSRLGYADFARPFTIDIYPTDFEAKASVIDILDGYNARMQDAGDDDKIITYTDLVGTLMSSVTDIINVVSYVLVAFVSISLVVSSIMIGVITYISVLERKKEIGILRSIGASKRDIRRVFNAETLIVGFVAGLVGIGVTWLLTIPVNVIVESRFNIARVAQLPLQAAAILVLISMGLTFLAGLIPSSAASRKDPVEALRSE